MAEGLLRAALRGRTDVAVASAGVSAIDGQLPSRSAIEACRALGIDITAQRSQQLDEDLVHWATHILVMTRGHMETIRLYFPEVEDKIRLVAEFDSAKRVPRDVPDPIGAGVGRAWGTPGRPPARVTIALTWDWTVTATAAMVNVDHAGIGDGRLTIGLTQVAKERATEAGRLAGLSSSSRQPIPFA